MCGYYSRAATIRCAATIRINTASVLITSSKTREVDVFKTCEYGTCTSFIIQDNIAPFSYCSIQSIFTVRVSTSSPLLT